MSIFDTVNNATGSFLNNAVGPVASNSSVSPAAISLGRQTIANTIPGSIQTNLSSTPQVKATTISTTPIAPITSGATPQKYVGIGVNANIDPYTLQPLTAPSIITPQNYQYTPSSTINSSSLQNASLDSLLSTHDQMVNDLPTSGNIPSDNLYSTIASKIYQSSQYTPEEQAAIQGISDANTASYTDQLAERRQIEQLQTDGQITQDQAKAMIQDSQDRAQRKISDATGNAAFFTNQLGVLGQIRGNQLSALQNYQTALTPTQVSPGSTLYNPITGVNYQGGGGSPQAILSYAQQLIQNDQSQGTLRTTATGQVDTNYYQQAAQQAFSGGSLGNSDASTTGSSNQLQSIAEMLVNGTLSPSNIPQGLNQSTVLQAANQLSMQTTGQPFDANKAQANYAATQAALTQNATTYRTLTTAQQTAVDHLNELQTYFDKIPKTSIPLVNGVINWFGKNLGSQDLQSYNTALLSARGEIAKVLAGGGSPSVGDEEQAKAALPDNMSPGQLQGAITAAKNLMASKIANLNNLGNVPQYGQSNQTNSTGGVVQTKVGAIPTNW